MMRFFACCCAETEGQSVEEEVPEITLFAEKVQQISTLDHAKVHECLAWDDKDHAKVHECLAWDDKDERSSLHEHGEYAPPCLRRQPGDDNGKRDRIVRFSTPGLLFDEISDISTQDNPSFDFTDHSSGAFKVVLSRQRTSDPWGLELDTIPAVAALVSGVEVEGHSPVKSYNTEAPEGKRIFSGDILLSANGNCGAKRIEEAFKECLRLELVIKRPPMFKAVVPKQGKPLGLYLQHRKEKGSALFVQGFTDEEDSAVKACGADICAGDVIVEVDGKMGRSKELLKVLLASEAPEFTIMRLDEGGSAKKV